MVCNNWSIPHHWVNTAIGNGWVPSNFQQTYGISEWILSWQRPVKEARITRVAQCVIGGDCMGLFNSWHRLAYSQVCESCNAIYQIDKNTAHNGGSNIFLCDGHAKFMSAGSIRGAWDQPNGIYGDTNQ